MMFEGIRSSEPRSYIARGFDVGGACPSSGLRPVTALRGGRSRGGAYRGGRLLPAARGRPFRPASDLTLTPVDFRNGSFQGGGWPHCAFNGGGDCIMVGGHFALTGNHANVLLGVLPPIVHIRKVSDRAALRCSGADNAGAARATAGRLSGRTTPHLHDANRGPAAPSGGRISPMEYLTRWRMLLAADKLANSSRHGNMAVAGTHLRPHRVTGRPTTSVQYFQRDYDEDRAPLIHAGQLANDRPLAFGKIGDCVQVYIRIVPLPCARCTCVVWHFDVDV